MKNIVIYPAPFIAGVLIGYFLTDWEKSLIGLLEATPITVAFAVALVLLAAGVRVSRPIIFPGEFVFGLAIGLGWRSQAAPA